MGKFRQFLTDRPHDSGGVFYFHVIFFVSGIYLFCDKEGCEFKTFYHRVLVQHKKKHDGLKQHVCEHCSYSTADVRCWACWVKFQQTTYLNIFPRKQDLTFHANCLQGDNLHEISSLFSGKNKKISKYSLLKFLPRMLSDNYEKMVYYIKIILIFLE